MGGTERFTGEGEGEEGAGGREDGLEEGSEGGLHELPDGWGSKRTLERQRTRTVASLIEEGIAAEIKRVKAAGITEELVREMAMEALACLRYHARLGNVKAAMYLVDRCMGVPQRPFADEVRSYTADQCVAALQRELERLDLPTHVRLLLLSRLRDASPLMGAAVTPVLPPPGGAALEVSFWPDGGEAGNGARAGAGPSSPDGGEADW